MRNIKLNKLLEKIMENTPVEIPESMIRMELDSRWRNLARRHNTDSEGLERMVANSNESADAIIESWRPAVVRTLHSRVIVETLIEELKLEASDGEVDEEIDRIAQEDGGDPEEYRKYYEGETMREYLKEDIKERKFFDILLEKNVIKAGERINYLELFSNHDHHDHGQDEE